MLRGVFPITIKSKPTGLGGPVGSLLGVYL